MSEAKTETVPCASCYRNGCSCAYADGECYSTDKPVYTPLLKILIEENKRLKEENLNLLNFRVLDNERLSKKIFKLDEENKRLKEENLKLNEYKFMYEELCKEIGHN